MLQRQNLVATEFSRIDGEDLSVSSTLNNVFHSISCHPDAVTDVRWKITHVEVLVQQFADNFADGEPAMWFSGNASKRHVQTAQLTDVMDTRPQQLAASGSPASEPPRVGS